MQWLSLHTITHATGPPSACKHTCEHHNATLLLLGVVTVASQQQFRDVGEHSYYFNRGRTEVKSDSSPSQVNVTFECLISLFVCLCKYLT